MRFGKTILIIRPVPVVTTLLNEGEGHAYW
jgi:hypothetical protein